MTEHMPQWNFVIAAYAIVVPALFALVGWALVSMRRAEARRDRVRGR